MSGSDVNVNDSTYNIYPVSRKFQFRSFADWNSPLITVETSQGYQVIVPSNPVLSI